MDKRHRHRYKCTHTCVHVYKQIRVHQGTETFMHAHIHTDAHKNHQGTHTDIHVKMHIQTCMKGWSSPDHADTIAWIHKHRQSNWEILGTQTPLHTYIHTFMCAHAERDIHTLGVTDTLNYMQTCTQIDSHICTCAQRDWSTPGNIHSHRCTCM